MTTTSLTNFDNVRTQIGYCGIWCGSCVVGNGALRELTRMYEQIIKAYGLQEWGSKNFDYLEFSKGLESIQDLSLCPGCLKGGGRNDCEIRACALSREQHNCTDCGEFGSCGHVEIVEKMRSGAHAAGLYVKNTGASNEDLIEGWTNELKQKWPCCILFMNDG